VLHTLICLVIKLFSQILYKWIPIYFFLKRLFLNFYANGFPYIFFVQKLFFSSSLQIVTHIFFSWNLYETTSCRSNSWTNQICLKLHKINPSLKLHQELFFPNKSIAYLTQLIQINLVWNSGLKSTMPWKLHGSIWVIMCDGVVLNCIFISCSFCLWWIACMV